MSVIFVVLPLAVLFSVLAVCVFFWAVSHGQFDDLTTPAVRALQDDNTLAHDSCRSGSYDPKHPGRTLHDARAALDRPRAIARRRT